MQTPKDKLINGSSKSTTESFIVLIYRRLFFWIFILYEKPYECQKFSMKKMKN